MALNRELVYSLRYCEKLAIPDVIASAIAKLRLAPIEYRPMRKLANYRNRSHYVAKQVSADLISWRENAVREYVSKIRDNSDPHYDTVMTILNKVAPANMKELVAEALTVIQSQDEGFRLRISTLIFNRAITGSFFASVLAQFSKHINDVIPKFADDFEIHASMFHTLYDTKETIEFPYEGDPDFDNKIIAWTKQKDMKRGYAKFLTQLYSKELISSKTVHESIDHVIKDLFETSRSPKTNATEENCGAYTDFLFECCGVIPRESVELRGLLKVKLTELIAVPKLDVPSLTMRPRFKLMDALKKLD